MSAAAGQRRRAASPGSVARRLGLLLAQLRVGCAMPIRLTLIAKGEGDLTSANARWGIVYPDKRRDAPTWRIDGTARPEPSNSAWRATPAHPGKTGVPLLSKCCILAAGRRFVSRGVTSWVVTTANETPIKPASFGHDLAPTTRGSSRGIEEAEVGTTSEGTRGLRYADVSGSCAHAFGLRSNDVLACGCGLNDGLACGLSIDGFCNEQSAP